MARVQVLLLECIFLGYCEFVILIRKVIVIPKCLGRWALISHTTAVSPFGEHFWLNILNICLIVLWTSGFSYTCIFHIAHNTQNIVLEWQEKCFSEHAMAKNIWGNYDIFSTEFGTRDFSSYSTAKKIWVKQNHIMRGQSAPVWRRVCQSHSHRFSYQRGGTKIINWLVTWRCSKTTWC